LWTPSDGNASDMRECESHFGQILDEDG
jgi:hypothetical protein